MHQASAIRSQEVEDLHSLCMLELARASLDAFAANEKYRRLRIRELDIMRTVAVDEFEEAVVLRKKAERQIGEVRHMLSSGGTDVLGQQVKLFPAEVHWEDSGTSDSSVEANSPSPSPSVVHEPSPLCATGSK